MSNSGRTTIALAPVEATSQERLSNPLRPHQNQKYKLVANNCLRLLRQLSESVEALSYCLYLREGLTDDPPHTYSRIAEWQPATRLSLIEPPSTIQLDSNTDLYRQLSHGSVAACQDWSLLHSPAPASQAPVSGPILMAPVFEERLLGFVLLIDETAGRQWSEPELKLVNFCASAFGIALFSVAGPVHDRVEDSHTSVVQHANTQPDPQVQLPAYAAHLQKAREEERSVIARELHDEFAQVLTAIKLDLQWLKRRLPGQQGAMLTRIDEMSNALDQTMHRVWDVASNLRPQILENMGLVGAIEWQLNKLTERTGAVCHSRLDTLKRFTLVKETEIALYRITQEALANIARHAHATRVDVTCRKSSGQLEVCVIDDGPGMPPGKIYAANSLGLAGMRERAAVFGGGVFFESPPDGGLIVTIRVPL